jgi:RND superfamily putative drug exporter
MFRILGDFAVKFRIPIIVGWILLAVLMVALAPGLEEVSSSDEADFLPRDAPFLKASEVQERVFPEQASASSSVIIVDAGPGGDVHDPSVMAYLGKLESWLNSDSAPANIIQAAGPITMPEIADKLISKDNRIALVGFGLNTITDAQETKEASETVDVWLEENTPAGIDVYQTGEAGLNAQGEESSFNTMDTTIYITISLVIVALLAIYRSPVSPLIPLFAVTLALIITIGVLGFLAEAGVISVIAQLNAILVVVMYGAGTDYNLFLISRFREEMVASEKDESARHTVRLVGETISSSAGTVFVGFMSLCFAEMGLFKSAGPMLAIGIVIGLLSGLTLVPALLATLGNKAFWPSKVKHRSSGRFYEWTSKQASSRPLLTILVIVFIMAPFSVYGLTRELNYDMIAELPQDIPSVKGYLLLQDHMDAGVVFPLSVIVTDRDPETMGEEIAQLTDELRQLDGVTDVRGVNTPLGYEDQQLNGILRVDRQLVMLLGMSASQAEESQPDPEEVMVLVKGLKGYLSTVADRFPEVATDANMITAQEILEGGLMSLAMRQGELMAALQGLASRFQSIDDAYLVPPTGEGDLFSALQPIMQEYLSSEGNAYKLEVVLADPVSDDGMDVVGNIRELLKKYEKDGEAVVNGATAMYADIRDTMARDQFRAFGFIMAGIFLVLLLMLRSAVAPCYLIATVLLSFTFTLGITSLFFNIVFGVEKLSWILPVFMFVFLVALGIDYSIFLFGRIKEEVGYHGIREGVHVAVSATGAIITSAGIILAGTFAGMMAGEIQFLKELGFAVAFGVLIDTFVVRTILDPALAALFGRWTWWPGGVPKAQEPSKLRLDSQRSGMEV